MRVLILFVVFVLLFVAFHSVPAAPTLSWDPNPAAEQVDHYTVYCSGQSAARALFSASGPIDEATYLAANRFVVDMAGQVHVPCAVTGRTYWLVTATRGSIESGDTQILCWDARGGYCVGVPGGIQISAPAVIRD